MIANKIKQTVHSYTTPKQFPITEFKKAVDYDFSVVENLVYYLNDYSPKFSLEKKTVLELGPGSDLGVGLILLMMGAEKYDAIDVNNLVDSAPHKFYTKLFNQMGKIKNKQTDISALQKQLSLTQLGNPHRLNYIYSKNFNLLVFENENVDLIISHAVLEHLSDVKETIYQIGKITKSGAIFIAEVDLKTHTRWIRDKDPLNIYRFSDSIYNLFRFSGSPNRLRPFGYESILKDEGWIDIKLIPKKLLETNKVEEVRNTLNERFQDNTNQMNWLSFIICATKK